MMPPPADKRLKERLWLRFTLNIGFLLEESTLINGIIIWRKAVGGYERRTVLFDIEKGYITYNEGDSNEEILWK